MPYDLKPKPKIGFAEWQLKRMGVLEPELWDLSFQAPIECIEWLDEIDRKISEQAREIEREKKQSRIDQVAKIWLRVCATIAIIELVFVWGIMLLDAVRR